LSKVICVVQYQQYRSPLQQMVTATRSAMLGPAFEGSTGACATVGCGL
jgi:hypothetical protein